MGFDTYLRKHGEVGVSALLDEWENNQGIKDDLKDFMSLEERWRRFEKETDKHLNPQRPTTH